jgi:hypothetical protein
LNLLLLDLRLLLLLNLDLLDILYIALDRERCGRNLLDLWLELLVL